MPCLSFIDKHLPMFFWSAIPCTGGSTAQRRNKHHPGHDTRMAKHNRLFIKLHRNLMILGETVLKDTVNGHFVFEWPYPNDWWQRKEMKKMVKRFKLEFVDFRGRRDLETSPAVPIGSLNVCQGKSFPQRTRQSLCCCKRP